MYLKRSLRLGSYRAYQRSQSARRELRDVFALSEGRLAHAVGGAGGDRGEEKEIFRIALGGIRGVEKRYGVSPRTRKARRMLEARYKRSESALLAWRNHMLYLA